MIFSPPGTILLEEFNIRYQMYSDEYFESTLISIIHSRVKDKKGNVFQDFSVDEETIKKDSEERLKKAVLKVIAIDFSKDTKKVVSQMIGLDFTTFISGFNKATSHDILNIIDQKLIQPIKDIEFKYGDILIATSLGVKKEYQHLNIGMNLAMLFLRACLSSSYKMISGFIYNSKVVDVLLKIGSRIISEVKVEYCVSIDKNIAKYMKNSFYFIAYFDTKKDISSLNLPSNILIRPSL